MEARSAEFYRKKAAQCRRLADSILDRDQRTKAALLAIAKDFDAQAAASAVKPALVREN